MKNKNVQEIEIVEFLFSSVTVVLFLVSLQSKFDI